MWKPFLFLACVLFVPPAVSGEALSTAVRITFDVKLPPVAYGAGKLKAALATAAYTLDDNGTNIVRIEVEKGAGLTSEESFRIVRANKTTLIIRGAGPSGAMYGALSVAENIRNGTKLTDIAARVEQARFPFRAIKFNLPWMSYRKGESLQVHQDTCRDLKFWEAFLDQMADNRFNTLSLWGLHPFTHMIRPTNFPEACGFNDEELADWQRFWKALFRMAKDRGIETYMVNWNIFVSPEFSKAHNVATYSTDWSYIGEGDTSDLIKRYTREVVTQVIDEYEDLAGLGITHGERMGGMTPEQRQQWFVDTFIAGMKAAKRPVKFIHRAPLSADKGSGGSTGVSVEKMTRASMEQLALPQPIWVEMKFNWSHALSSPHLVHVHGGALSDTYWNPPPKNYRMVWMARNEDVFCLRWGEPGFIRKHIELNGQDYVGGYFVGSECYIPASDYFTKPDVPKDWQYAFQRQWFFYKAWGRLLYDPATTDEVFKADFVRRYGADGEKIHAAMVLGSRMPLRLNSFYKATWDFTSYAEGFLAAAGSGGAFDGSPFISVDELIDHATLDPDYVSIKDFVEARKANRTLPVGKISPLMLADALERDGREALRLVDGLDIIGKPAFNEVTDCRAWAYLSLYFADKLRGGVALHSFRKSGVAELQQESLRYLERAVGHWQALIQVTEPVYRDMPLIHLEKHRDGRFHWSRFLSDVKRDVETAKQDPGLRPKP